LIEVFAAYWPVILVAVLIGLVVGFLIFRPRQRVRLTDSAPIRPHMAVQSRETVLGHEAEVTTKHVLGDDGAAIVPGDELERLKGVGPKLAAMLNARGISRFDQIARLSDSEVDRIDAELGAFRGRMRRDRIVEQADYPARGDADGFEQKFGKL
jgi:predicted flap endonuclease-1-like 5' DNA nuclease